MTGTRLDNRFWLLFGGETASAIGTAASMVAMPVLAFQLSGNLSHTGIVGFAMAAAAVATRLPGGVLVDRVDRRKLMVIANLIAATAVALLAVALAAGAAGLLVLVLASVVVGAVGSCLAPAESAAVRGVVPEPLLPKALAFIQSRAAVAMVAGPVLGGALVAFDATTVFVIDALTYLFAAVCMAAVRIALPADSEPQPVLKAAGEGLRFVLKSPFLRYVAINATLLNLVFNSLLVILVAAAHNNGKGGLAVGVQMAAIGVGALAGAIAAAPIASRFTPAIGVAGGTALVAVGLLLLLVVPTGWPSAVVLGLAAAAGPVVNVVVSTEQIRLTPAGLQGRVNSSIGLLAMAAGPLGPIIAGFTVAAWGVAPTMFGAAAIVLILALVGAAVILRATSQTSPAELPEQIPELAVAVSRD
ncbi:MFS transporter [Winogradskya humida]|uniref:Major facilitator superfamily (MFS) profile domain-containing protein n=1 Tax=Winogradskya humida TaxID=113566 RepID=A0ABQ4A7R6_9ACTN|nr:MFS transporter [Actinoplanes humidus]GIE26896.1 hypothetical protein Ahu01nite_099980 [Actinoplanes humidus]